MSNARQIRLENAAPAVARGLTNDPTLRVVIGRGAYYNWERHELSVPAYSREPADPRLVNAHRGVLDHECAHVVLSDFRAAERALKRWEYVYGALAVKRIKLLWNVFEDVRIERLFPNKYPGSRFYIRAKNEYITDKRGGVENLSDPEYIEKGSMIGALGALLNSITIVGRGMGDESELHPGIGPLWSHPDIAKAVSKGITDDTADGVIDAAEELYKAIKALIPPPEEEEIDLPVRGGGDGESAPGDGSEAAEGPAEGPPGGGAAKGEAGSEEPEDLATAVLSGEFMSIDENEYINREYDEANPDDIPPYTVHPRARDHDEVIRYGEAERRDGRMLIQELKRHGSVTVQALVNLMRSAVLASRQTAWVGGVEDGDRLDDSQISSIAMGLNGPDVFMTQRRKLEESTGVMVLVDCSGSMDKAAPRACCPVHGRSSRGVGATCAYDDCDEEIRMMANTKAAYAAITAMALHEALRSLSIPHAVGGFTCFGHGVPGHNGTREHRGKEYKQWSRKDVKLHHMLFVEAPGRNDEGDALAYIDGRSGNADGESVLWAAQYAAAHFGHLDRVILLVVSDGLPAGVDDGRIDDGYLRQSVDRVARAGIEVYGIGMQISNMTYYRSFYPDVEEIPGVRAPTGCSEVPNGEGLSNRVLRDLTHLLTRGLGASRKVSL